MSPTFGIKVAQKAGCACSAAIHCSTSTLTWLASAVQYHCCNN